MKSSWRQKWERFTGQHLPSLDSVRDDPAHIHKLPTMREDEHPGFPLVWIIVISLVVIGFAVSISIDIFSRGGLVVWPFVFAVAVLLIINDASAQNGVGVPPFQAYALFFGIIIGFFLFVALISTVNPWVVLALVAAAAVFVIRDWKQRRERNAEIDRRRSKRLCVRCMTPVTTELEAACPNCGLLVHGERLSLLQLSRAIRMRADPQKSREVLTGKKPGRADQKLQRLRGEQPKAYKYRNK